MALLGVLYFSKEGKHWGASTDETFDALFKKEYIELSKDVYAQELKKISPSGERIYLRLGDPNPDHLFFAKLHKRGAWNTICCYKRSQKGAYGVYFCAKSLEDAVALLNEEGYIQDQTRALLKTFPDMSGYVEQTQGVFDWEYEHRGYEKTDETILSERELFCLKAYARGTSLKEIGHHLHISPRTVQTYLERSKKKIGLSSKQEILQLFFEEKT